MPESAQVRVHVRARTPAHTHKKRTHLGQVGYRFAFHAAGLVQQRQALHHGECLSFKKYRPQAKSVISIEYLATLTSATR
jgi:hypothetical protein